MDQLLLLLFGGCLVNVDGFWLLEEAAMFPWAFVVTVLARDPN